MAKSKGAKGGIRRVTHHWPTFDEFMLVLDTFSEGSENKEAEPIVLAILGAAMIEHMLDSLIRVRFKRYDDDTWAKLTGEYGPLSSLAQKINAAYAFGLCDEINRKALMCVKDIRNAFAHAKKILSFDDVEIRDEFNAVKTGPRRKTNTYKALALVSKGTVTGKNCFMLLCIVLLGDLQKHKTKSSKARAAYYDKRLAGELNKLSPRAKEVLEAPQQERQQMLEVLRRVDPKVLDEILSLRPFLLKLRKERHRMNI